MSVVNKLFIYFYFNLCIIYNILSYIIQMGAGSSSLESKTSRNRGSSHNRGNSRSWKKDAPNDKERALMLKKCGKKCFLGPGTSFPICTRKTCDINRRGVQSAYSRAREWAAITAKKKHTSENAKAYRKYVEVAKRAKRILKNSTRRK